MKKKGKWKIIKGLLLGGVIVVMLILLSGALGLVKVREERESVETGSVWQREIRNR